MSILFEISQWMRVDNGFIYSYLDSTAGNAWNHSQVFLNTVASVALGPHLLIWFNFNPSMDK